jgi:SAM-dependent methyltransferase
MESARQRALVQIGEFLRSSGYRFVTPTPRTHQRAAQQHDRMPTDILRAVFGWNREFTWGQLPAVVMRALANADAVVETAPGAFRATIRYASWQDELVVHSGFPTTAPDAVFFGPDSYRFARFLCGELRAAPAKGRILDLGCGTGIGAIVTARNTKGPITAVLSDVNQEALAHAGVNFVLADLPKPILVESDLFAALPGDFDLVVANPPYLNDASRRLYRHGGGATGEALSLRILDETMSHLAPGGRLLLYTGVAVIDGEDPVSRAARQLAKVPRWDVRCEEIDVDVFGEELETDTYAAAERIAVLGIVVTKR